ATKVSLQPLCDGCRALSSMRSAGPASCACASKPSDGWRRIAAAAASGSAGPNFMLPTDLLEQCELEGTALGRRSRQEFAIVGVENVVDAGGGIPSLQMAVLRLPRHIDVMGVEGRCGLALERIAGDAILRRDEAAVPAEGEAVIRHAEAEADAEFMRRD